MVNASLDRHYLQNLLRQPETVQTGFQAAFTLSLGKEALWYNKAVGLNNALKVLEAFIKSWIKYSAADRKLRMCIVTAQARWRSKVEIELLGL
ncbi:hypothetical protein [Neisseria bergeri]|uniref:hypothetical protein n=1 Tax=Neisseria bergeri TaxID=1906581 RepID=UPI0027E04132|nr:hypothetical protein [Neisseria bergeri]